MHRRPIPMRTPKRRLPCCRCSIHSTNSPARTAEMQEPKDHTVATHADPGSEAGGHEPGYNPLKETLARAEEATTALRANYTKWARADVDETQRFLDSAKADPAVRREQLDQL